MQFNGMTLIMDRNYISPRTGQSSRMQAKIMEHIKISLRTISIKFLLVITTLYKSKNGIYQVYNTVPSSPKVTVYPQIGKNSAWHVISIITANNSHTHQETHLHTVKVITILIPSFQECLGPWPTVWGRHTKTKNACIFSVSLC